MSPTHGRRLPDDNDGSNETPRDSRPAPDNGASTPSATGKPRRPLSEISHLFLSDLRNGNGQDRPQRKPPAPSPFASEGAHPADHAESGAPDEDDLSIDVTPEEFEGMLAGPAGAAAPPPVCAVLGVRLNGRFVRRACQYAAGLARNGPVGMLVVEPNQLRVIAVTAGDDAEQDETAPEVVATPEQVRDVLTEVGCDVTRWLIALPDPRLPVARRLLALCPQWVLLASADHEGVVAGYRTLKGLCDLELPEAPASAPRVTIALLDAPSADDAQKHARKLIGVCRQFLDLDVCSSALPNPGEVARVAQFAADEVAVGAWPNPEAAGNIWPVVEQILLRPASGGAPRVEESSIPAIARPIRSKSAPPQSKPAARPGARSGASAAPSAATPPPAQEQDHVRRLIDTIEVPELARPATADRIGSADHVPAADPGVTAPTGPAPTRADAHSAPARPDAARHISQPVMRAVPQESAHAASPPPFAAAQSDSPSSAAQDAQHSARATHQPLNPLAQPPAVEPAGDAEQVVELAPGASVTDALIAGEHARRWAITPLVPPMLPGAKLAVHADGRVILIASARPGLGDLAAIGRALGWASENRPLIAMALSQWRIDRASPVHLHLLVHHADARADALAALMGTGRVTLQSYRRLTWAGRQGLLLEAA